MPEKEGKITQQQAAKAQEASVRTKHNVPLCVCIPLIPTPLLAAVWDSRAVVGAAGRARRPRLPCRYPGPGVRPDQVETRPANRASAKFRRGERVAGGCEGGNRDEMWFAHAATRRWGAPRRRESEDSSAQPSAPAGHRKSSSREFDKVANGETEPREARAEGARGCCRLVCVTALILSPLPFSRSHVGFAPL